LSPSCISNVIVETLKRTKPDDAINAIEIAQLARTTPEVVMRILRKLLDMEITFGTKLDPEARFKLASEAARLGALQPVLRALTWQEFETFSDACLSRAGFETQKGLVFKDERRHWQIDIVATRGQIILALDCKHWESRNYSSGFYAATEHHRRSLGPLIRHMKERGHLADHNAWALPVIITLFEPRISLLDGVVLTSVGQLTDFLEHLTPYDPELPFVSVPNIVESSIC
jgi:Holliday junction resolvase-like predicted endonuclease